jgi:hypothetical protein
MCHYWAWRKRLMVEWMCQFEDEKDEKVMDQYLQRLKVGSDIENTYVMGYLKNENRY